MAKYTIGVDYGSLSGRAVLLNLETGAEVASSVLEYPHAVMDEKIPSGQLLPPDFALQHPQDYLDVLAKTIPDVLKQAGVSPADVIGIATDFTACTVLPVKRDGTPLCMLPQYADQPHAYVKLWKHHAAQDKANQANAAAAAMGEGWLARYGGKISSEWAFPKYWEILAEAPAIYAAADLFVEAADWVIWQLCGQLRRNACTAGYKAMWHKQDGYPAPTFFKALDPRLENIVADKLAGDVVPLGQRAGVLTAAAAKLTGLPAGIAVAVGNVDAHVTVPAAGIDSPGKMLAIIGTSTCHMVVGSEEHVVPGMCGVVEDGILPGFFGYEAGQSCVGDHFDWFVKRCVPADYQREAQAAGESIFAALNRRAARLKAGESGLVALDWFNGNRSVLVDVDLTGLILGLTLQTKPEENYRALIEATAYGTRKIIETFRANGVPVNEFYAAGGIARKDALVMQIYADVLGMPVKICGSDQAPALGSAIFAAVAAGAAKGGYDDIFAATRQLGRVADTAYAPTPENAAVYDRLYAEYSQLHDYFGRGANDVMKRLKTIKNSIREGIIL